MKKSLQPFAIVLLFTCLSTISFGLMAADSPDSTKASIQWHEWSDEVFTQAQKENKLVLVDIKAKWCQFCKKMSNVTYQDPEVIDIINKNYIAIRGDIETTPPITRRYGYFGVPATVILTGNDKELNRRLGYINPQFMQWHLLGILQEHEERQKTQQPNAQLVGQNEK